MDENKKNSEAGLMEIIFKWLGSNKKNIFNFCLLLAGAYLLWSTFWLVFDMIGFIVGLFLILFALSELKVLNLKEKFDTILKALKIK